MREDDAASEESFQSADEEDDFDPPTDLALGSAAPAQAEDAPAGGEALPPGLDESEGAGVERWNLRKDGNKEQLEPIWSRLSQDREHVKISKMFSYVLRHAAHKLDVRIRKDGFVRLREIMKLRNFKPYNLEELMAVVYFDEKERYTMVREFDGELLIRANQGHTMKVVEDDLLLEPITDPSQVTECVHGSYLVHWPFIKRQGLSKVARNHIHLANGLPEDGKIRGMRSTAELFIYVDVPKAMEDGIIFYRSKNEVILTQGFDGWIPAKYFQKAVRIDYSTCDVEELEFEAEAEVPSWPAELAPTGPGEQGTYLIKNLEALISNCRRRLQEINELKALADQGKELDEDDQEKLGKHAQVYTELQSLEQRFRQHKGYRRESVHEREQRAKEEAEAGTVVKRKDRAVTPPWERGKSHMESTAMKATEKEKAEWAALGRRRDSAAAPAKKDDPWAALGRGRQNATAPPTPSATPSGNLRREEDDGWRRDGGRSQKAGDGARLGREGSQRLGREDSWRFGREDSQKFGREDSQRFGRPSDDITGRSSGTPNGPPRFFNSRKMTDGPSWRDRMTQAQATEEEEEPHQQPPPTPQQQQPEKGPSWREQMVQPQSPDAGASWRTQMAQGQTDTGGPAWRSQMGQLQYAAQGAQQQQADSGPSWRSQIGQLQQAGQMAQQQQADGGPSWRSQVGQSQQADEGPSWRSQMVQPQPGGQMMQPHQCGQMMQPQQGGQMMQPQQGNQMMQPQQGSQMMQPQQQLDSGPFWRSHPPPPLQGDDTPSWRNQMQPPYTEQQVPPPANEPGPPPAHAAMLMQVPTMMGGQQFASFPSPTGSSVPGRPGMSPDAGGNRYVTAVPMWQGSPMNGQQMCGYGMGQAPVYYANPTVSRDGSVPSTPSGWMGGQVSQYVPQSPSAMSPYAGVPSSPAMQQGCGGNFGFRGSTGGEYGAGPQQGACGYGGQGGPGGPPGGCGPCGYQAGAGRGGDGPLGFQRGSSGGFGYQGGGGGGGDRSPGVQDPGPGYGFGGHDTEVAYGLQDDYFEQRDDDDAMGGHWQKGGGSHAGFGKGGPGRGSKKGGKGGGKGGRGGFGKDRGDSDHDWEALGRLRAAS